MLIYRLGGQFDAETFEGLDINLRQHDGGVNLAAAQFFELFQGDLCVFVGSGAHGQRDQNFIGVETRVAASEVLDFQLLDRLDRAYLAAESYPRFAFTRKKSDLVLAILTTIAAAAALAAYVVSVVRGV